MLHTCYTLAGRLLVVFFFFTIASHASNINPFTIISTICIQGNNTTKDNIILRELAFKRNDTIITNSLAAIITKSRDNLLNTSLFNFVTIDTIRRDTINMDIAITVIERWYIWPFPIFEIADRNFNVWWKTKDFSRTNYGVYIVKDNFRGRKETLKFKFQLGYNEEVAFSYTIPYINKKQTIGLGIATSYSRNHEVNYASSNNEQLFFKDEEGYIRKRHSEGIRLTYRRNQRTLHYFETKYNFASVGDTIAILNPDYFLNADINFQYFSAYYRFEYDERNSKYYPITGYYFAFEAMKNGFGIIGDSRLNADYVIISNKNYLKINQRWYAATGIKGKISVPGKPPYALQKALGYYDFVRGYDYYVVDGQHYGLLKSEVRFVLVPTQIAKLPFIKTEKFNKIHYTIYLNAYVDAGYVWDKYYYYNNSLSNTFLLGSGISLNYVTYYDKMLGIDFSINKMKEPGIFLHYIAPI